MKKKLVAVLMVLTMMLSMMSCTSNTSEKDSTPNKETPSSSAVATSETNSKAPETTVPETNVPETTVPDDSQAEIYAKGPNGETAVSASTLGLTDEEINKVKEGKYKAAIVMHYGGNDWATAQIDGLKATFEELGIEVVAVTDANFSAEKQVSNIETVMAQKPDIIVSIPTDATATADAYKTAAEAGIKLVFMDNVPAGMTAGKDYVSCVSADNYGNGCIAADILGESLNGEGQIAMVYYDADFFVTNQRDQGFRDQIAKKFPNIEIVSEQGFTKENGCSEQGDAILTQYPNIAGIYASWDIPMEGVLSSVRAAGKEGKIKLATIDLGNNIAKEIANGTVAGLGAQMPYDQGVAEATLAAMSLLGKECPAYVAVPAKRVDSTNVLETYEDVYHITAPDWLKEAAGK